MARAAADVSSGQRSPGSSRASRSPNLPNTAQRSREPSAAAVGSPYRAPIDRPNTLTLLSSAIPSPASAVTVSSQSRVIRAVTRSMPSSAICRW